MEPRGAGVVLEAHPRYPMFLAGTDAGEIALHEFRECVFRVFLMVFSRQFVALCAFGSECTAFDLRYTLPSQGMLISAFAR